MPALACMPGCQPRVRPTERTSKTAGPGLKQSTVSVIVNSNQTSSDTDTPPADQQVVHTMDLAARIVQHLTLAASCRPQDTTVCGGKKHGRGPSTPRDCETRDRLFATAYRCILWPTTRRRIQRY